MAHGNHAIQGWTAIAALRAIEDVVTRVIGTAIIRVAISRLAFADLAASVRRNTVAIGTTSPSIGATVARIPAELPSGRAAKLFADTLAIAASVIATLRLPIGTAIGSAGRRPTGTNALDATRHFWS